MQREEAEEARTAVRARRRGGAPWYHEYAWSTLLRHVLRGSASRGRPWPNATPPNMFNPSLFENPEALAKLASLNPLAEGAVAANVDAGGSARASGKRTIAKSGGKVAAGAERIGGTFTPQADPDWLKERSAMLDGIAQRNAELMAKVAKPDISVTLPNGAQCPGQAYVTTPLDIATSISKGLAQAVVVASVKYSKRYEGVATIVDVAMGDEDEAEDTDQRDIGVLGFDGDGGEQRDRGHGDAPRYQSAQCRADGRIPQRTGRFAPFRHREPVERGTRRSGRARCSEQDGRERAA